MTAAALVAVGAWWALAGGSPAEAPAPEPAIPRPGPRTLRDEAWALLASRRFAEACARLDGAAGQADPAARHDAARCFGDWAWATLREGRPAEARALFRHGLAHAPGDPALLRGLGLAAIHDGRVAEAVEPLERSVDADPDPEVHLLLARLWDRRDRADRALVHLRAVLERAPTHAAARALLEKLERERHAEAGFRREATAHFVVKHHGRDAALPRAVLAALERARTEVGARLGYWPDEPLLVVLYEDAAFREVTRVHGWVTGLFDGKIRLPVGAATPPAALEALVRHEYAHAAVHALARGRAPRWLQEGLAQLLEGAPADPMLRVPTGLTLRGLEALVTDPDPVRARAGYDLARWVVDDLAQRGGLEALRRLLGRLGAGASLDHALAATYGHDTDALEAAWHARLGG